MASHRVFAAGLPPLALTLALSACAPSTGASGDVGYETVIAAVVLAESDAGGRAFQVEVEDGTAQVTVAGGDGVVEVDVRLSGPTVTDRREEGDLDADDRAALDSASTALADGIRVAVAAHGGGASVSEVDLEPGDDAAWTVAFTDGGDVTVAVADGAIQR